MDNALWATPTGRSLSNIVFNAIGARREVYIGIDVYKENNQLAYAIESTQNER